jgi:hypothetical protein
MMRLFSFVKQSEIPNLEISSGFTLETLLTTLDINGA